MNSKEFNKQVDKSHYGFEKYLGKARWISMWHQLDEVIKLHPSTVLEIGPGPGVFKSNADIFGIKVKTLDLDPDLKPDYVASAMSIPADDSTFDVVCAFQVLEHLPYSDAISAFKDMMRVSKTHVVISLPDAQPLWRYRVFVPKLGVIDKLVRRPFWRPRPHTFNGEHYWEINKLNYPASRIESDFGIHGKLLKSYRVNENPYHRFFIYQKLS